VIGPGDTKRVILDTLKREGTVTIPDLAAALDLNVETVRSHVKALVSEGLIARCGVRRDGPGRPEGVYELTRRAARFFPGREGQILHELAAFLDETGHDHLLEAFFRRFAADREARAAPRLEGLDGLARVEEVARFLTEEGYMAEVVVERPAAAASAPIPRLRLCNCPIRDLVRVTRIPCGAEIGLIRNLLAEPMVRVEYIPDGDAACGYAVGVAPSGTCE